MAIILNKKFGSNPTHEYIIPEKFWDESQSLNK
jgi:hypothetical protein